MDRFIVESTHDSDSCHRILDLVLAQGYLAHFDWGCDDGVHCGWAIIEADDHSMALMSVPPLVRGNARAIRLVKYSSLTDIAAKHEKE